MPKIDPKTIKAYKVPGKLKVDPNLSFIERCHKKYDPTDTVQVRNITSVALEWWWLEEKDESYVIEDGSNIKIVSRKDPGFWRLDPGEVDVMPGSCAYVMMDALFKQTRALKTGVILHPLDEGEIRNFALDDPQLQDEFIRMVFEGKLTPTVMQAAAMSQLGTDNKPKILENLPAVATERSEYERRQQLHSRGTAIPASLNTPPQTETAPHQELNDLQDEFEEPFDSPADGSDPRAKAEKTIPPKETVDTPKSSVKKEPAKV